MKAYDFILNKKFLNQQLIDNVYYFRIDFDKLIEDNKVRNENEFIEDIKLLFENYNDDINEIINAFREMGYEFEYEDTQIWQNPYKDLIVSKKGLIKNIEDLNKFLNDYNEVKSKLLKDSIFIRLLNYIK